MTRREVEDNRIQIINEGQYDVVGRTREALELNTDIEKMYSEAVGKLEAIKTALPKLKRELEAMQGVLRPIDSGRKNNRRAYLSGLEMEENLLELRVNRELNEERDLLLRILTDQRVLEDGAQNLEEKLRSAIRFAKVKVPEIAAIYYPKYVKKPEKQSKQANEEDYGNQDDPRADGNNVIKLRRTGT